MILRIFENSDLRCGHDGLALAAKRNKIDVRNLGQGEYVVFLNTAGNKAKIYATNDIVAYYRPSDNKRITLEALKRIPLAFNSSTEMSWGKSLDKKMDSLFISTRQAASVASIGKAA